MQPPDGRRRVPNEDSLHDGGSRVHYGLRKSQPAVRRGGREASPPQAGAGAGWRVGPGGAGVEASASAAPAWGSRSAVEGARQPCPPPPRSSTSALLRGGPSACRVLAPLPPRPRAVTPDGPGRLGWPPLLPAVCVAVSWPVPVEGHCPCRSPRRGAPLGSPRPASWSARCCLCPLAEARLRPEVRAGGQGCARGRSQQPGPSRCSLSTPGHCGPSSCCVTSLPLRRPLLLGPRWT